MTSVDPLPESSEMSTVPPPTTQSPEVTISDTQTSLDISTPQPRTLENPENVDISTPIPEEDTSTTQPQEPQTPPTPTDTSERPKEPTPVPEPSQTPTEEITQSNNSNVGQEDRIDIFTVGMDDDQEFPNTDGMNVKSKDTPTEEGNLTFGKSNPIQSLEFSDKENKRDVKLSINKSSSSIRDKILGTSKHKEHHTHKDLREILTKNSVATNKKRDLDTRRNRKNSSRSGIDKPSSTRDKESNQRRRRMYQEIKNTLSASTSSGFGHHELDPEKEWEDKKREREMQRIEVERARRELDSRRRQDSQSSQRNTNGLKRSSVSSLFPDSRSIHSSLSIEGDLRDIPIPPVVPPQPSDVPVSRLARVQNLVRPFTQTQLKCMLELYGSLIMTADTFHHYFWTDKNKTQCCCIYLSIESCEKARKALHGARWPSINPKTLNFTFLSIEQFNELTGLSVNNEILDKHKQEIVKTEPTALVEKPKDQEDLNERRERVKERLKEKDLREKEKRDRESRDVREKKKSKSSREFAQAKRPPASTSDEKKHHVQSKDHSSSQKDKYSSQKDRHTSQKDRTSQKDHPTTSKDHLSYKDHSSTSKDHSSQKDHSSTSKDHSSQKDHSTTSKDHSSQRDISKATKDHSNQKDHSSSKREPISSKDRQIPKDPVPSKDHSSKVQHGSSQDQLTLKDHPPASKDHTNQKDHPSQKDHISPKVKEKPKTEPKKPEAKSKQTEPAPKAPKLIKLDKSEENQAATKRPTSTRPSSPPSAKKPRESKEPPDSDAESEPYQSSGQAALLDTLFRKTVTEPCIYWLPLTDKQIKMKIARQKMRSKRHSSSDSERRSSKRKYSRSPRRHKRK